MSYLAGLRVSITAAHDRNDQGVFDPTIDVVITELPAEIKERKDLGRIVGTVLVPETKEAMHQRMSVGASPRRGVGSKDVKEVHLQRLPYMSRAKRWRWDITFYDTAQSANDGVYDARIHLYGQLGYARTRRAALRQLGRYL